MISQFGSGTWIGIGPVSRRGYFRTLAVHADSGRSASNVESDVWLHPSNGGPAIALKGHRSAVYALAWNGEGTHGIRV